MAPDPVTEPARAALVAWSPDASGTPAPDPSAAPEGFVVLADDDARLHFLDWGGPAVRRPSPGPGILLVPGLLQAAWSWAPVARRLAGSRWTVAEDLRGHGLSDSPMDGYDLDTLAADVVAVADGAGLLEDAAVTLAGHGFGAIVAAAAAARLGERCDGLVLVDGGWERLEVTTGLDVEEFLRGLPEPPEVLRSMPAYLADRRDYDPGTWDADQERAARDGVVETAAGHVVQAVRPFVVEAVVRTMFAYEPAAMLASVSAPVTAIVALGGAGTDERLAELRRTAEARVAAGRRPVRAVHLPDAHNLMRYRPAEVTAVILAAGSA